MTRSLDNLEHQNFGIATANRYVLQFDPKGVGYSLDRLSALYRQIEDRFLGAAGNRQRESGTLHPSRWQHVGFVCRTARTSRARSE